MQTRLRNNVVVPKQYNDGTVRYLVRGRAFLAETETELSSHLDALDKPMESSHARRI